jgi:hypothetical protein
MVLAVLVLIAAVPALSTWLPGVTLRGTGNPTQNQARP